MAGKVYPQQHQVSPRRTPVCFIFFAFLSSAKLRQFHFCRTTSNRPKNPLGTTDLKTPVKGHAKDQQDLRLGTPRALLSVLWIPAAGISSDSRTGLQWGLPHHWHGGAAEGRRGARQEDSPRFWSWRAEHTSRWLGKAMKHRSFWHPLLLIYQSPQRIWKKACFSPDWFSLSSSLLFPILYCYL